MSRHRNVRNLDIDDVLDEADPYEDESEPITDEQREQLATGVARVQSVLDGVEIPRAEIEETLWYYYFDVEKSIEYLLSQHSKAKTPTPKKGKFVFPFSCSLEGGWPNDDQTMKSIPRSITIMNQR